MKNNMIPVGLKKADKGVHSTPTVHKAVWYQRMWPDGKGGPKYPFPMKPPCAPANAPWPYPLTQNG